MGADSNGAALIGLFYAERNREYPLRAPVLSVGRSSENTLRIRDERIAARHVRIARDNSRYVMEVTAETEPTTLNGSPLSTGDRRTLSDGDLIGLADLEFRFSKSEAAHVLSRLWVVRGVHRGKTFRIERPEVAIGRATDNDVQFPDRSVSRHHCRIRQQDSGWFIEDLDSTNSTLVNGAPIQAPRQLEHGDEVAAGFSRFVFQQGDKPLMNLNLEPLPPCN